MRRSPSARLWQVAPSGSCSSSSLIKCQTPLIIRTDRPQVPKPFHAGLTADTRQVLATVYERHSRTSQVIAVGFSLGANILAKYLGEEGTHAKVHAYPPPPPLSPPPPKNCPGGAAHLWPQVDGAVLLSNPWDLTTGMLTPPLLSPWAALTRPPLSPPPPPPSPPPLVNSGCEAKTGKQPPVQQTAQARDERLRAQVFPPLPLVGLNCSAANLNGTRVPGIGLSCRRSRA